MYLYIQRYTKNGQEQALAPGPSSPSWLSSTLIKADPLQQVCLGEPWRKLAHDGPGLQLISQPSHLAAEVCLQHSF